MNTRINRIAPMALAAVLALGLAACESDGTDTTGTSDTTDSVDDMGTTGDMGTMSEAPLDGGTSSEATN